MSDSSDSVWSEIIPLFLSEGLWVRLLQGALKRGKGQKKQQQKRNYLDNTTFCYFVVLFVCLFCFFGVS